MEEGSGIAPDEKNREAPDGEAPKPEPSALSSLNVLNSVVQFVRDAQFVFEPVSRGWRWARDASQSLHR